MANQRDINRWQKGKDHWNKWAKARLKAKEKLEKEERWAIDKSIGPISAETERWIKSANVDFVRHVFDEAADFSGFLFPWSAIFNDTTFFEGAEFSNAAFFEGAEFSKAAFFKDVIFNNATFSEGAEFSDAIFSKNAIFDDTTFSEGVEFSDATFSGNAWFNRATFSVYASFPNTTFSEEAEFSDATFSGDAIFSDANFSGYVEFNRCNFVGRIDFNRATFDADAAFNYAKSGGPVSLTGARFDVVPDFIGMSFRESVRLDDLNIVPAKRYLRRGDKNRAARYRVLKKLAIDGLDHLREQEFFAGETRERRGNDDPTGSAKYILGFAYEIFSDFGRSVMRPLAWWALLFGVYTSFFLLTRDLAAWLNCGPHGQLPFGKAAYLSLVNSFPFIGLDKGDQIKQVWYCLYGVNILPLGITAWMMFQTLLSTILLFLFLLALRNHFRIK